MEKRSSKATKQIGIHFGDNDFYFTVMSFLRVLTPKDRFTHHLAGGLTFTKGQIVDLFNGMATSLYFLKQNGFRSNNTAISAYLRINESKVYLDDEVTAYMSKRPQGDNGEFFAVNLEDGHVWAF